MEDKFIKQAQSLFSRLDDIKYSNTSEYRLLSKIYGLDNKISGFKFGEITIWTGTTNAGKTTLLTQLARNIIEQGERIFFFNGEQTGENFKNNLFIQCSSQKDIIDIEYEHTSIIDKFVKTERAVELDKLYGNKIFVYNNEEVATIDKLLTAMFYLRKTEKIKVFFLDNFMQIEMKSSDLFREQGEIMERLRRFAIATKSQIHLVAHPRKTEKSQYRLSLYDIARKLKFSK